MFDPKRSLQLARGALFNPEPTWRGFLPEAGDWKRTALLLTGPLIIVATLAAWLLGLLTAGSSPFGPFRPTLMSSALSMLAMAVAAPAVALIFGGLAGRFGGRSSFPLGLAATTLAFVPGYLGQVLVWLPWIGNLLALGLGIYGLVLLWRIIPIYLEVPAGRRASHYIVSLLASIVLMFVLGSLIGPSIHDPAPAYVKRAAMPTSTDAPRTLFGDTTRRAVLLAQAQEDTYAPPADGKLSEPQLRAFIQVMQRAAELLAAGQRERELIVQRAQSSESLSVGDMARMMSDISSVAGMEITAEIEAVASMDGNWAEHQWVRESLHTAKLQRDTGDAVAHNYRLYRKYQGQLAGHLAP